MHVIETLYFEEDLHQEREEKCHGSFLATVTCCVGCCNQRGRNRLTGGFHSAFFDKAVKGVFNMKSENFLKLEITRQASDHMDIPFLASVQNKGGRWQNDE